MEKARTIDTERLKDGLVALKRFTSGYDPTAWRLSGKGQALTRQLILGALKGERVPKSKAGTTALEKSFFDAGPDFSRECLAGQRAKFEEWARLWLLEYKPESAA